MEILIGCVPSFGILQQKLSNTIFSLFLSIFDLFAFCLFFYIFRISNVNLEIPKSNLAISEF